MSYENGRDLPITQNLKSAFGKLTGRLVTVTERNGREHTGNLTLHPDVVADDFLSRVGKRHYGSQEELTITPAPADGLESD